MGSSRSYAAGDAQAQNDKITQFINERSNKGQRSQGQPGHDLDTHTEDDSRQLLHSNDNHHRGEDCCHGVVSPSSAKRRKLDIDSDNKDAHKSWSEGFKVREETNLPRNCVKVKVEVKERIVGRVFTEVLGWENAETMETETGGTWLKGG